MRAIALNEDNIHQAYEGAYYTILGAGGKMQEWYVGYQDLLNRTNVGTIKQWYSTTGKVLNNRYKLKGKNRFKDNLKILMFPLDGLDVSKLAMFRLRVEDHWFNDVIDNSKRCSDE